MEEKILEQSDSQFHISADSVNATDKTHVLNHYNTFGIFDRWGNILKAPKMSGGIYHEGMRFINALQLYINKQKPLLLSSSIKENNDILSVDLTNPFLPECHIPENMVHISRSQFVRNGAFYEEIICDYYGSVPCSFTLSLKFGADFKDLFEIRGIKRELPPLPVSLNSNTNFISFSYKGYDNILRSSIVQFNTDLPHIIQGEEVLVSVTLQPQQKNIIQYCILFEIEGKTAAFKTIQEGRSQIEQERNDSQKLFANIFTSNEQFNQWMGRSKSDLLSLLAKTSYGNYPYAGVPWYNTIFGRDGLITAIFTLWIAPDIAKDVLYFLSQKQATEIIPEKDAQPGKIVHEIRSGEMANIGEVPFKEYYGTIDATPLFVMLSGMYFVRTADITTIQNIWPHILAALEWINTYGDIDGDGFVEYEVQAEKGLSNQGWKDSFDAVMHQNGELAESPIALCEVQAYVYAAKHYAAIMAKALQQEALANKLEAEAIALKEKFNEQFWDKELRCYVLALDGNKQPCRVITSNAGHTLFTQIAHEDKAIQLADTLLNNSMFSGWGIRTLSAHEKRYNPISYHNGSIWPHDNALIAYGLSLYGLQKQALKITQALFDASLFIELQRMPELYCGFERRSSEGPTSYPVACSPQAWSVAAVFLLLQACLKLEINALEKTITLNSPELPEFLPQIYINNLKTGNAFCSLHLHSVKSDIAFNLSFKPEDWKLIIKK